MLQAKKVNVQNKYNCPQLLWKLLNYKDAQEIIDKGLKINPNHFNLNLEKGAEYVKFRKFVRNFKQKDNVYISFKIRVKVCNIQKKQLTQILKMLRHIMLRVLIYFLFVLRLPFKIITFLNEIISYQKKYDEEIKCYEKAIQLDPNHAMAYNNKGCCLILSLSQWIIRDQKKYDEAMKCFDKAIQLDPNLAIAYYNKGLSLILSLYQWIIHNSQKYDEAIKCYDKAIQLEPNYATAYNNKGNSLILSLSQWIIDDLEKYDEAIKCYDKAIQLDPNLVDAFRNKGITLIYSHYVNYIENQKQYNKAIECYNMAIQKGYEPKQQLQQWITDLKNK